ncbi:MAG: VWA domain-containing protein [Lewinellaceae bacterium]|nr:VWA domain-containing protein [Lewinellaceae bacterium]
MFRYEYPDHFYLLGAVPLLALLLIAYLSWRKSALKQWGATERVMPGFSRRRFGLKNALLALVMILLAITWANPQRGVKKQTSVQRAADVFIALDISKSMLCEDVAPGRLELAKVFAEKLIRALEGERVGLIFFAGNAFLQMPLSVDYSFTLQSIQSAAPDLITEQGTALASAIELADQSFGIEPGGGRAIVIISDGEDHGEDALRAAGKAYDDGAVVYTIGAGTLGGGPIPEGLPGMGQYKRDDAGEIVRTRLDETLLRKIANEGGGQSFNLGQGDAVISALRRDVNALQKRELEVRSFAEFESWYQWFLLPALLLLLLEWTIPYRKRNG